MLAFDDISWIPTPEAAFTANLWTGSGPSWREHKHGLGEEILVLSGVFPDESGDFGPGAYVRPHPGNSHTPFSKEGCKIFVKLRQMRGDDQARIVCDSAQAVGQEVSPGYDRVDLFEVLDASEFVALERLAANSATQERQLVGGEEILLLEGDLSVAGTVHQARSWLRQPPGSAYALSSSNSARFWVKLGHLNI